MIKWFHTFAEKPLLPANVPNFIQEKDGLHFAGSVHLAVSHLVIDRLKNYPTQNLLSTLF